MKLVTEEGDGWKCTYPSCDHPSWKRHDQKRNWESHWLHAHRASEEFMNHFLPDYVARLAHSRQLGDAWRQRAEELRLEVEKLEG